jgi:hypothetical protein
VAVRSSQFTSSGRARQAGFSLLLHRAGSGSCLAFCLVVLDPTGGERQTDSLEVFPEVLKLLNGTIGRRFFLHGLRHVGEAARERAERLHEGETSRIVIEVNNPATTVVSQFEFRLTVRSDPSAQRIERRQ